MAAIDVFTAAVLSFAAGMSVGILMMYAPFLSKVSWMRRTLKEMNEYFIKVAKEHSNEP